MTMQGVLVAARFLDKRLVKGWTADFGPDRDFFHVERERGARPTRIPVRDLKGVFFLKTPGRPPGCTDRRSFGAREGGERKVWLEFRDGEKFAGWSNASASARAGFFVFPADPDSNLEKVYVFRSALVRLEEGIDAEAASRAHCAVNAAEQEAAESGGVGSYRLGRAELRRRGHGREEI